MEFSLVIPVLDEEKSLIPLQDELHRVMERLPSEYEIIYVDDGSRDSSLEVLKNLKKAYPRLNVISFKKNRGKSTAFSEGFKASKGEWIITLDADSQIAPREIIKLLENKDRFDFITGVRKRREDNFLKVTTSATGKFFLRWILKDATRDPGCSLRMFRKEVIDSFPFFDSFYLFFPFLAKLKGFRVKEVYVDHRRRKFGKSKYRITRKICEGISGFRNVIRLKNQLI